MKKTNKKDSSPAIFSGRLLAATIMLIAALPIIILDLLAGQERAYQYLVIALVLGIAVVLNILDNIKKAKKHALEQSQMEVPFWGNDDEKNDRDTWSQ